MYGFATAHPAPTPDSVKSADLRECEVALFARKLPGKPMRWAHMSHQQMGKVEAAWVNPVTRGIDIFFSIDEGTDFKRAMFGHMLQKRVLPDVSLGHYATSAEKDGKVVYENILPYEVSVTAKGHRDGTNIYALYDKDGKRIFTNKNTYTNTKMTDTQQAAPAPAQSENTEWSTSTAINPDEFMQAFTQHREEVQQREQRLKEERAEFEKMRSQLEAQRAQLEAQSQEMQGVKEEMQAKNRSDLEEFKKFMDNYVEGDEKVKPYKRCLDDFHETMITNTNMRGITACVSAMSKELEYQKKVASEYESKMKNMQETFKQSTGIAFKDPTERTATRTLEQIPVQAVQASAASNKRARAEDSNDVKQILAQLTAGTIGRPGKVSSMDLGDGGALF